MTAAAGAIDHTQREVSPWRAVGLFLLLTAFLSGIFCVLINATQTVNAAYIFGLMWMPAVAAILTCRILGRPLRTLGLGTWNGRYVLIGYLIPMVYLMWSLRYGKVAGTNPFGASGLEWTTTSPPPTENFLEIPTVTEDAYTYPVRAEGPLERPAPGASFERPAPGGHVA